MIEKPQKAREDKLEDGKESASSTGKKKKSSAVYLYLLILFGAAFLMLLLAYFVQQRNRENTASDLHNSMSLSREKLPEVNTAFHFDFKYSQAIDVSRETER